MASKAKLNAAQSPGKAASERRVRELQAHLHESEANLVSAQEHAHQLTQGLDASNDLIQVGATYWIMEQDDRLIGSVH